MAKGIHLGSFPSGLLPLPPRTMFSLATPNLSLSLCPLCRPQISNRHKFRLFHILETIIGASDSLEETWEQAFMKLALENMTKSTVGPSPSLRPVRDSPCPPRQGPHPRFHAFLPLNLSQWRRPAAAS